jgi:hypothetical protein
LADWELTVADYRYGDAHLAALESATPDAVAAALRAYLIDAAVVAAGSGSALREADLASVFE